MSYDNEQFRPSAQGARQAETARLADHPHTDPGDGRTECQACGKWVFEVIHSCKRVPVTQAAMDRLLPKAERPCRDCGKPFVPVQRGECSRCGSDGGPVTSPASAGGQSDA